MKKSSKITLAVLAAGVVLSLAVRIFVIIKHTDMNTGFLYHGDEILWNGLYYGVIIAAMAASIFTARADEKRTGVQQTAADITGARAVVMSVVLMAAGLSSVCEGIAEIRAISPSKFLMIIDFVFGGLFILIAFFTVCKRRVAPWLGLSYMFLGMFCICRCMYCFMNRMVILTIPEYLIESISLIVMSVFFVLQGRYLSGRKEKHTKKALCFWGVGASSLVFSSVLGTLIASVAAPEEIRRRIVYTSYAAESFKQSSEGVDAYKMTVVPLTDVMLGLIVVTFLVLIFLEAKHKAEQPALAKTEQSGQAAPPPFEEQ